MRTIDVIEAARIARGQFWQTTSDVSIGDKQAAAVTTAWQRSVASIDVQCEVPIKEGLKEKIDVIDLSTTTAYEMKVSSKNPHHEFYKDIFKVLIYNQHHERKVKRLVFITEKGGADKLNKGLGKAVREYVTQYNLSIEVMPI
jgi:hypothetical protein